MHRNRTLLDGTRYLNILVHFSTSFCTHVTPYAIRLSKAVYLLRAALVRLSGEGRGWTNSHPGLCYVKVYILDWEAPVAQAPHIRGKALACLLMRFANPFAWSVCKHIRDPWSLKNFFLRGSICDYRSTHLIHRKVFADSHLVHSGLNTGTRFGRKKLFEWSPPRCQLVHDVKGYLHGARLTIHTTNSTFL